MRGVGFHIACLIAVASLALLGCTSEGPAAPDTVATATTQRQGRPEETAGPMQGATVLAGGQQLAVDDPEPEFLVIADESTWSTFWQTYAPEGHTESPDVDFDSSFVLVGIQGAKSTGGYDIAFSGLRLDGDQLHVLTDLEEPVSGESAEAAFTQPYTIVQVDSERVASGGALTFIFETEDGRELARVTETIAVDPDLAPGGGRRDGIPEPPPATSVPRPDRDLAPVAQEYASQSPTLGEAFTGATILAQGLEAQYEDPAPRFLVITDPEAWTQFWSEYLPDGRRTGPELDFSASFALVGLQGSKSTGGYSIGFAGLEQDGQEVQIVVQLREPDPGGMAETTFTQPYVVVEVDSTLLEMRGALTFIFRTEAGEELGRLSQTIP